MENKLCFLPFPTKFIILSFNSFNLLDKRELTSLKALRFQTIMSTYGPTSFVTFMSRATNYSGWRTLESLFNHWLSFRFRFINRAWVCVCARPRRSIPPIRRWCTFNFAVVVQERQRSTIWIQPSSTNERNSREMRSAETCNFTENEFYFKKK